MTGDQQFWLGILTQVVVLVGVVLTYLKASHAGAKAEETSQKADRNSAQVADLQLKVDGKMDRLLAEKDERITTAERAANAEGQLSVLRATPQSSPVQVVVPTPGVGGEPASGPPDRLGRRATDPPVSPPDADPTRHEP